MPKSEAPSAVCAEPVAEQAVYAITFRFSDPFDDTYQHLEIVEIRAASVREARELARRSLAEDYDLSLVTSERAERR